MKKERNLKKKSKKHKTPQQGGRQHPPPPATPRGFPRPPLPLCFFFFFCGWGIWMEERKSWQKSASAAPPRLVPVCPALWQLQAAGRRRGRSGEGAGGGGHGSIAALDAVQGAGDAAGGARGFVTPLPTQCCHQSPNPPKSNPSFSSSPPRPPLVPQFPRTTLGQRLLRPHLPASPSPSTHPASTGGAPASPAETGGRGGDTWGQRGTRGQHEPPPGYL